jgi:hypothetical protein
VVVIEEERKVGWVSETMDGRKGGRKGGTTDECME